MPVVLGHEGSGTVAEVGPEVTYARPGEHVVLSFVPSCGRCSYCLRGRQNLCEVRYGLRGNLVDGTKRLHKDGQEICHFNGLSTFGEYAVVPEDALVLVRDDAPLDKLALIGCGVPIGVGAAINTAKVQPGSRVVIGVGGVGLNVVQGAALAGAGMIIAVHIRGTKLEQSLEFGATHLVNAASEDVVARVRDITNGEMAYIPLMPIFAVDILKVGADGQGWLMGIGGVAAKGGNASKTLLIIGGGIMSGVSVAAFALTSVWVGSFALALVLMFVMGVFNTMQNTVLQASMQILVPEHIRGRVMGLYGMTYNIRSLGSMQAGALAGLVTAPFAIAIGGLAVAVFAAGAALTNRDLRRLTGLVRESESAFQSGAESKEPARPAAG